MIEPALRHARTLRPGHIGQIDAHPVDREPVAGAVVGLHEHAHRVVARHPGRGADAALEAVADHPGAAAHRPFRHRPGSGARIGRAHVRGGDVPAVDVVEQPVPGLGDHRQRPGALPAPADLHLDQRVAHDAHGERVRQADRRVQHPEVMQVRQAGHLAVAVEPVEPGVDRLVVGVARVRPDHGHPGARGPFGDRGMPDQHPGHIGDRIVRPRRARADGDAVLTRPQRPSRRNDSSASSATCRDRQDSTSSRSVSRMRSSLRSRS